ncbi:MAG: thioredoxin domain-containing protein [bacterium]|nr:thioredoxin domain-containing protein [bacterium]
MRLSFILLLLLTSCSNSQVHTNALIHEASPYLLQHAHNPVDWLPWGDAAFEKARAENKPVFLSVGYAACHWCHVMEQESFENEQIAGFLNEHFIAIKVDREERPDVDHHYMQAVQRMTGSGGWPMSVFLTPDRKPFYGGTYWAPEARYGRPGFMDVLKGLAKAWETEHDSVIASSLQMHDAIHAELELKPSKTRLTPALLDSAVRESERNFDPHFGGFSKAPKFPHAMELAMLVRYYSRTGDEKVKHMVEFTLDNMARGGIFDQIGGGFHRYSTDDKWLVPHFEKMLYDNALLIPVYKFAASLLGRQEFAAVVEQTYDWARKTLWLPEGGFASSLDADSEGEEGRYYVWTPEEVHSVLGDGAADYCRQFDIVDSGNFDAGRSVPNRLKPSLEFVSPAYATADWIRQANFKLREFRTTRQTPARDDKALCDWNGLMISAMVLHPGPIEEVVVTAHRFASPFERGRELVHSFLSEKELRVQLLMDYAALGNGLLDLFCVTGRLPWFDAAYALADEIERRFAKGDGLYYMSEDSVAGVRSVDLYDSALPSGNSLAGNLFIKLYYLTGEERFRARAEKQIKALMPFLERIPTAFSQALMTAEWLMFPPEQIIVVQPLWNWDSALCGPNRQSIYISETFVQDLPDKHPLQSLLEGKSLLNGKDTYYICRNFSCELPITDSELLKSALKKPWQN